MDRETYNIHADIVERCLLGDRKAYEEIYVLYSKAMFNVALRLVKDHDEAEDVLQDAFISAFSHLSSYHGSASFGAWLKRIVINKSLNVLNKRKPDPLPETLDVPDESVVFSIDTDEQTVKQVKRAMMDLPDGYRTVLSLYLMEGYDHQEISDIMGISVGTSKSQYNRAKKRLKETLTTLSYEREI